MEVVGTTAFGMELGTLDSLAKYVRGRPRDQPLGLAAGRAWAWAPGAAQAPASADRAASAKGEGAQQQAQQEMGLRVVRAIETILWGSRINSSSAWAPVFLMMPGLAPVVRRLATVGTGACHVQMYCFAAPSL